MKNHITSKTGVSFERMLSLLNDSVQKYAEELGNNRFRNPSFVFADDRLRH